MALISTHPGDAYPAYSKAELWSDFFTHCLSTALAFVGFGFLLSYLSDLGPPLALAVLIYGASLCLSNGAALLYHSIPLGGNRQAYRRLDHAAIFLLIAGTYTPLILIMGGWFSLLILGMVWALALYLAARRLFFWAAPGDLGYVFYLALGWMGLVLIYPMATRLPLVTFVLILLGALFYSCGIAFYVRKNLQFSNTIWHLFVLCGSISLFASVAWALQMKIGS